MEKAPRRVGRPPNYPPFIGVMERTVAAFRAGKVSEVAAELGEMLRRGDVRDQRVINRGLSLCLQVLRTIPTEELPEGFLMDMWTSFDEPLPRLIAYADAGNKVAQQILRDFVVPRFTADSNPMIAYLARQELRKRGKAPKISDAELTDAFARARQKNPNANPMDLANMLAAEGLGNFHPDALRRRLNGLNLL